MTSRICGSCSQPLDERPRGHCRYKGRHVCGARHGKSIERCTKQRDRCMRDRKRERDEAFRRDPSAVDLTASDVMKGAYRFLYGRENQWRWSWACFEEYPVAIGAAQRRVDLYAVSVWPKRGPHVHAFEIKCSRGDLLTELKNPDKRQPALAISTHFSFATPQGLVKLEELPADCGLIEVRFGRRGALYVDEVVAAPEREFGAVTWDTYAALAMRVAQDEGTLRR